MLSIKNNLMAAQAASNAATVYGGLSTTIKRLSSGLRINSAIDDAAGLAVRELIRADIATARQGSANVRDGISMVQTADGAASAISDTLVRMKQLAVQAGNGTYSAQQKGIMQQEFSELAAEITRITENTSFNGINLFADGQTVDIALGDGDTISIDTQNISLGSADLTVDPAAAQAMVNTAISQVSSHRGRLGAKMNRLGSAATVIDTKAENLLAAESRVSDMDVARGVTSLASTQVQVQAATAAQAHANIIMNIVGILLG
ncbi:MAG: flagellin [Planctomycetota bacterium]|jgi:flagellin